MQQNDKHDKQPDVQLDYDELIPDPQIPVSPLARLAKMLTVVVLASLVPYALPGAQDYRYWDRLSIEPLRMAVKMETPQVPLTVPMQEFAQLPVATTDAEEDEVPLAPEPGLPEPGLPQNQLEVAQGANLPAEVSANVASAGNQALTRVLQVTDEQLGDQKVWLEGNPHAMDGFTRAMADLAAGKRSHVRIAHYGDSHLANDGITDVTRKLMQRRFGDGGHGFTLVMARTQWYHHKGVKRTASDGWKVTNFLNGNGRDGAYGYGGVAVEGGPGEWFQLDSQKHPVSRATLYYRSEGRATLQVKIDGKTLDPLQITAKEGTDGTQEWTLPLTGHQVSWKVLTGRVRLFGGALETDRGVVYDSLGEVGARGTRWLQANAAHLSTVLTQRNPDLVILNYGGNERIDKQTEQQYLDRMVKVIHNFVLVPEKNGRAQPARSCLLIGPSDHGVRKAGKVVSDQDVIRIIDWQRKLAKQTGCAFWDARAQMGGEGSMGRWVQGGLGWSDYAHFSPKGEAVMGLATYRALLQVLRKHVTAEAEAQAAQQVALAEPHTPTELRPQAMTESQPEPVAKRAVVTHVVQAKGAKAARETKHKHDKHKRQAKKGKHKQRHVGKRAR